MRFDIINIYHELQEEEGDNEITIRLGKTGSGKTLIQTELDVLPLLLDDQDVWCCYWLNWNKDNYHYFAPRQFDKVKDQRNTSIVFDEIRRSFEPRAYEGETEEFRSFVELHRHRHNNIIGNTQDISLVAKTFSIQTHNWSQVSKSPRNILLRIWDKMTDREKICIEEDYLTYGELKKIANGWELGENVALDAEWHKWKFNKKDLIHHELDEYKVELVHKYCKKCRSRQGEMIKKEDTEKYCDKIKNDKGEITGYRLKEKEFCPKHKKEELIIRESGMFDTDYEPEKEEKNLKAVYYETCDKCGKEHIAR